MCVSAAIRSAAVVALAAGCESKHNKPSEITEALDRVVEQVGSEPDPWVEAVTRQMLETTEW